MQLFHISYRIIYFARIISLFLSCFEINVFFTCFTFYFLFIYQTVLILINSFILAFSLSRRTRRNIFRDRDLLGGSAHDTALRGCWPTNRQTDRPIGRSIGQPAGVAILALATRKRVRRGHAAAGDLYFLILSNNGFSEWSCVTIPNLTYSNRIYNCFHI